MDINRRNIITGLGATGVALGLARATAFAQGAGAGSHHRTSSGSVAQQCIDACTKCHNECVSSIQHCLEAGGDHAKPDHVQLLRTCAEICTLAADSMLGSSEFDKKICALCEEICRRCADSCDQFSDAAMKQCATACRECADACKRFVQT